MSARTTSQRTTRAAAALLVVVIACLLPVAPLALLADDGQLCPDCGHPVEPGAAFCTNCGHKLAAVASPPAAAAPAVDPGESVVRVVAAHDKEMTSAYGAIAHGTTVRVDSMIGTGFAVSEGEFVTDSGLVTGVREVFIYDRAKRKYPATVVGVDHQIGVALLRAEAPGIPPLAMRSESPPRIGERIRAYGYPSESGTVAGLLATSGVLSGTGRSGFGIHPIEDYQQTDATLPSGFAGGPVIDEEGRLVGMSTALPLGRLLLFGPVGIGVSVPVDWIERAREWIRAGQQPRPWLGVIATSVDTERRKEFDFPSSVGAIVEEVFPGGPAAQAGLRRGDGVVRADGIKAAGLMEIRERLLDAPQGSSWTIEIVRDGRPSTLAVTLVARPANPRLSALSALRSYGGLEFSPRAKKLTVERVLPDTLAEFRGIEPGDVLRAVLIKKDLERVDKGNARWRSVRKVEKLEEYLGYAYSDLDFFVGLRFKSADGSKRWIYLHELLITTSAL